MLHLVQSAEGRVTPEGIEACAEILDISAADVSGVATFYTMYKRRPVGDYHVGVCTNTLCAVMGGDLIFERLKDHLDVGNDETTERRARITLEHVECNAACDYAPVMMVNWEFMDNMTPESAVAARRRPPRRHRGPLHPRPADRHLARGRAGARRLPRRPRRRGPGRRTGLAGRARHRPRARLDRPARRRRGQRQRPRQPSTTAARRPTSSRPTPRAEPRPRPRPAEPRTTRRSDAVTDTLTPVLTDNWGDDRALDARGVRGPRRLRRPRQGASAMAPDAVIDGGQGVRPARPRRRRLPDRHEVGLHPAGQPQAEVPRRQRRRVRAGHLQGHPADDGQPAHAGRGRRSSAPTPSAPTPRSSTSAARSSTSSAACSAPSQEAYLAGHLGTDIHGSGFDLDVVVHAGAGAYICGEETALLEGLEGRRGQPRLRPPFPAVAGLYASPTVINNVESIASVPSIIAHGHDVVRLDGHREVQGLRHLLAVRPRRSARASTKRRSASRCAP